MGIRVPQDGAPMRTGRWYLKFAFACLAAGFGGWLLLAILCIPVFGYRLFTEPYTQLLGGIMTVSSTPFIWHRLR